MSEKTAARFFAQIEMQANGCWLWTGCSARGYGRFHHDGTEEKAHRFSYRYFIGALPAYTPSDGELDHLCRNRGCVNPTHLELVRHQVNIQRGNVGGYRNEDAYKRVSAALRGKPSPMLGRLHSAASKAKQSAARRAFWQRKREAA